MPERTVLDSFWTDPSVVPLTPEAKTLYLYSWTNSHNNAAGIYEIGLGTIAHETGWPETTIRKCLDELRQKVDWFEEFNIIWVKSFLNRQSRSPKYLTAVVIALRHLPEKIIIDYLDYNLQRNSIRLPIERLDTLSIGYRYPIDTRYSILSSTTTGGEGNNNNTSKTGESEGVVDKKAEEVAEKGVGVEESGKVDQELAVIVTAYESNIGMITPAVAEELKDVASTYPVGWFAEAMKEAVGNNARKLKYITAILERWRVEGYKADRRARAGPAGRSRSTRPGKVPTADELKEQERRLGIYGSKNDNARSL